MNEKPRPELTLWENHMSLKRVLIVDDAMDLGRLYQDALRTLYEGVPVTFVPSAEEAMLETSRYTFDLMIADIRLPGMSGFDLVRKLRARQPNIKVIMITGMRKDARMDKEFFESGAQKLLVKPVSIPDFLDTVREVVGDDEPARAVTAPLEKPAVQAPATRRRNGRLAQRCAGGTARHAGRAGVYLAGRPWQKRGPGRRLAHARDRSPAGAAADGSHEHECKSLCPTGPGLAARCAGFPWQ